jgi:hypothetical protein
MSSAHVNIGVDASEKNDGWVSIAGKARYALLPIPSSVADNQDRNRQRARRKAIQPFHQGMVRRQGRWCPHWWTRGPKDGRH